MPSDPHREDGDLAARCLAGEAGAWTELVGRHGPLLQSRLSTLLFRRGIRFPPEDLDDLLSKVWEDLLRDDRRLLRLRPPEAPLDRWLLSIAVDRLLTRLRAQRRLDRHLEAYRSTRAPEQLAASLPAGPAASREDDPDLQRALSQLSPREQFAVRAFYWGEWSYQRIARTLEIPLSHVAPLLQYARQRLHALLRNPRQFLF